MKIVPIDRLPNTIPNDEFYAKYANYPNTRPVVFESMSDAGDLYDPSLWTRKAIKRECGGVILDKDGSGEHCVQVVNETLTGKEWGSLQTANLTHFNVTTLADLMEAQETTEGAHLYLHDAALYRHCPKLLPQITIPKYIRHEYELVTHLPNREDKENKFEHEFPSFFLGRAGTHTPLHADSGLRGFHTQQLAGRKLWRMVDPKDYDRIYPTDGDDWWEPTKFGADLMKPDFERFPILDNLTVYETILEPGNSIYIPGGWPHQVKNLDDTAMISQNWVEPFNIKYHSDYETGVRNPETSHEHEEFPLYLAPFIPLDDPYVGTPLEEKNVDIYTWRSGHFLPNITTIPRGVRDLVEKGQEAVNGFRIQNRWGMGALHMAVAWNFVSVVRYLLDEGGADVNLLSGEPDMTGRTGRRYAGRTAVDVCRVLEKAERDNMLQVLREYGGLSARELRRAKRTFKGEQRASGEQNNLNLTEVQDTFEETPEQCEMKEDGGDSQL